MNGGKQDERTRRLAGEVGAINKSQGGRLSVALAFPNTYSIGMSTLGFHIVYREFNAHPLVVCERAFLPEVADRWSLRSSRLTSLESDTPLADFDVVAFSIHFEMDYANILRILDLAGIPRRASQRGDANPLIIAGGPCATFNPEPLAEFVDAFVIGDAEGVVAEIAEALLNAQSHEEALESLAQLTGVYVPRFYEVEYAPDGRVSNAVNLPPAPRKVKRGIAADLDADGAFSVIRTPDTEFGESILAEMTRGCARQCRFCVAGYISLPPRPRLVRPPNPAEAKRRGLGLVGPSVLDHPNALAICSDLVEMGTRFSVSSLRAESLTPGLANLIARAGQRTLTIAPETGTLRLRKVINKAAADEELLGAARMAGDAEFSKLKLYFMVGLPTETDEDVAAIADLVAGIAAECRIPVEISVSAFVPKPWTPFQWYGMANEKILRRRLSILRKNLKKLNDMPWLRQRITTNFESPGLAVVQGILARGDRRVSTLIATAADSGGNWRVGLETSVADPACYAYRERQTDEILPWDHIDMLVSKEYLIEEYRRALREETSDGCDFGGCVKCGVCLQDH